MRDNVRRSRSRNQSLGHVEQAAEARLNEPWPQGERARKNHEAG
jgi:hypothetical protein